MAAPKLSSVFLVRTEHLNHQGHLFGGDMMAEIDTVAYCLIRSCYGEVQFVTRAAEFGFEKPAKLGNLVHFCATRIATGRTSVTVGVEGRVSGSVICSAKMVFVHIDADDQAAVLPEEQDDPLSHSCPPSA